jgi:hypothetical protein
MTRRIEFDQSPLWLTSIIELLLLHPKQNKTNKITKSLIFMGFLFYSGPIGHFKPPVRLLTAVARNGLKVLLGGVFIFCF